MAHRERRHAPGGGPGHAGREAAHVVRAQDGHRRVPEVVPAGLAAGVGRDDPRAPEPAGVQRPPQPPEPRRVGAVVGLVPPAQVGDRQPALPRAAQPAQQVADVAAGEVGRAALADQPGGRPLEPVQLDPRVAPHRLLGDGELIARVAVDRAQRVLDARLAAGAGVGVTADLQLEDLQRRAVARLEQVVQDLAALAGRVVHEEPRVPAAAQDGPHPVIDPAAVAAVHRDPGDRQGARR